MVPFPYTPPHHIFVVEEIYAAFLSHYGHETVCNDREVRAIWAAGPDYEQALPRMKARHGQPSPRVDCAFDQLPTVDSKRDDHIETGIRKFGDYEYCIRSEAIDRLADKGVFVWQPDFDPNSNKVLAMCLLVENEVD